MATKPTWRRLSHTMNLMLKRKTIPLSLKMLSYMLASASFLGIILSNAVLCNPDPLSEHAPPPVVHVDTPAENLVHAWKNERETCPQWLSSQRMSKAYLDAYIIGVQKGATSELCMRLGNLDIHRPGMVKEWHFFETLLEPGESKYPTTLHMPYTPAELHTLRLKHYLAGFPTEKDKVDEESIPMIDDSPELSRKLVYDGTVEYMLSDRAAFLAHALTPHAKLILTLRDPLTRALSQYNMMVRVFNHVKRKRGEPEIWATEQRFDDIVRKEIGKLTACGYDAETATLDRPTSQMLKCMYEPKYTFDDLLYVTRGLYYLHISTWRNYYPDHRMHFMAFDDLTEGKAETMQDLAEFLCIKPWDQDLLDKYAAKGSKLSFGQQAAEKGLSKLGFESYSGKDKYMLTVLPETRKLMDEFFAPANARLERMLGRKMW